MLKRRLLLILLILIPLSSYEQWLESGINNNDPWEIVYGVSVPESGVIWGFVEHQNWAFPKTKYTRSIDNGTTWSTGEIDTLSTYVCIKIKALDSLTAFASTLTWPLEDSSRIYRTQDGGVSWQLIPSAVNGPNETCIDFHFFDQNNGLTYGAKINGPMTLYTCTDGGTNWSQVPLNNIPLPLVDEGMLITSGNGTSGSYGSNLWFGTTKGRIFHTSDNGNTWDATLIDSTITIHGVAFKDNMNGLAISGYSALANSLTPNRAWITADGGLTWVESTGTTGPLNMPKFGMLQYLPGSNNTYISTNGGLGAPGTLISEDGGHTWVILDNKHIYGADFISEYEGWGGGRTVANDKGMHRWVGAQLSISNKESTEFKISPSIANSHIVISNYNSKIGKVIVYSISGQIIDLPINGNIINISGLETGSYILVIKGEDQVIKTGRFVKM